MKSIVNYVTWGRKEIFEHFSKVAFPYYQVASDADVTFLLRYCRDRNISFYLALIHEVMCALNGIENFRYRLCGEKVWLYDKVHPSFCHLPKGEELFRITTCRMEETLYDFVIRAQNLMETQESFIGGDDIDEDALVYISCIPWIPVTMISNEHSGRGDESVPMINWGQYRSEGDRTVLNITVDVNHRLIDGYHIGMFFTTLQKRLDAYKNIIG